MSAFTLMIQGTTSDAGKSTLVAGLCRVLHRIGISVAPFKPQNMALNSAVSIDGGEIGRAQAVQAQACGIPPHSDMNPVLLKPSSDQRAQVIVHGKVVSDMDATEFHYHKLRAMDYVLESYRRLAEQYDVIIVEGAGSPAEINLREGDIANMGFAEAVDCEVAIIADIDRGGVFAHLCGTLDLLSQTEQARITGFIINRFRGDIELLKPGIHWLEQHTGKKVFGTLPFLHGLHLEAEDALNSHSVKNNDDAQRLRVVVPVLPRISNHTDFDSLRLHPQIDFTYLAADADWPDCDLIILPGSKNVRADLKHLMDNGWQQKLQRFCRYGGKVIGICGGYQMLGLHIKDPEGLEDTPGSEAGFGLVQASTELKPQKVLQNRSGKLFGKLPVKGYEIHMGETVIPGSRSVAIRYDNGDSEGYLSEDNQILGTYLHGLFDQPEALQGLLAWAGLDQPQALDYEQLREQHIDRLADCLEENLDFRAMFKNAGIDLTGSSPVKPEN